MTFRAGNRGFPCGTSPVSVNLEAPAREKRAKGAAEALHSGVLDGLSPSPAAVSDARDYVDGRRTLDEIVEDVVRRHTRRPKSDTKGETEDAS